MKIKHQRLPDPSLYKLTCRRVRALRYVWQAVCLTAGLLVTASGLTQPVITSQPQSQTNIVGTTATFSVEATNAPSIFYQWQRSSTDLTSETNTTLVLTNVQTGNAGPYSVVVSNVDGAVTSDVATLTVLIPPSIASQPTNLNAVAGERATLGVTAAGTAPLAYQWRFNGQTLAGQTRLLTFTSVQFSNAGNYFVVITKFIRRLTI